MAERPNHELCIIKICAKQGEIKVYDVYQLLMDEKQRLNPVEKRFTKKGLFTNGEHLIA